MNPTSGVARFSGTHDSTSYDTGALVVSNGGLGVAGAVHFGSTLQVASGIDANGSRITNVASPVNPFDAVNRAFLESVAQGLSTKKSVYAASVGSVILASVVPGFSVDDVVLSAGDRVLIKDQTNPVENGIYVVSVSGAPTRSTDLAVGQDANAAYVFVEGGTVNTSKRLGQQYAGSN